MDIGDRMSNGRFAAGNAGGPGRPRRAVERDYLATLSEAVSLDDWRDIVRAAVTVAKQGDAKARDWLARHLLGENPISLTALAADEAAGLDGGQDIIERLAQRIGHRKSLERFDQEDMHAARSTFQRNLEGGKDASLP
jgi:hypothetical protein